MVKTHGFPADFPLNQSNECMDAGQSMMVMSNPIRLGTVLVMVHVFQLRVAPTAGSSLSFKSATAVDAMIAIQRKQYDKTTMHVRSR